MGISRVYDPNKSDGAALGDLPSVVYKTERAETERQVPAKLSLNTSTLQRLESPT